MSGLCHIQQGCGKDIIPYQAGHLIIITGIDRGLTTALTLTYGTSSPLPIIMGMVALVVMTDATAVRLEAGRHARFLNRMVEEGREPEPEDGKRFQTMLGHTAAQVAVGFAIGLVGALLLSLIPAFGVWQ